MENREKIISVILEELRKRRISQSAMCKELGIPRSIFSRWARGVIDERNENKKPASIKAEYLINVLYYLNILK